MITTGTRISQKSNMQKNELIIHGFQNLASYWSMVTPAFLKEMVFAYFVGPKKGCIEAEKA